MAFYKLQTLEQFIGIFVSYRKSNFYASLWFFVALFFGELLMYPIVKIIGKKFESENKNKVALTIFGIFLSVLGFIVLYYIRNGFFWSLDLVPLATSFLMFGYVAKLNKEKFNNITKLPISILYLLISIVFTYLNFRIYGSSSMYNSVVGNFIYYMPAALGGILLVITICKKINSNRLLEYIGRNTITYYAFQKPIILKSITTVINTLGSNITLFNNQIIKIILITIIAVCVLGIISQMITSTYPFILGKFKPKEKIS